ncbi:MAG: hypothetical protein ACREBJ_09015 [Nitrosotalea sp.]
MYKVGKGYIPSGPLRYWLVILLGQYGFDIPGKGRYTRYYTLSLPQGRQ